MTVVRLRSPYLGNGSFSPVKIRLRSGLQSWRARACRHGPTTTLHSRFPKQTTLPLSSAYGPLALRFARGDRALRVKDGQSISTTKTITCLNYTRERS